MTNKDIIAEIRLAPGEVGYYDDYSRIYLTNQNPTAKIYAGTNTRQIVRSVASGRLLLISGTFDIKQAEEKQEALKQERIALSQKMAKIADEQAKEEKAKEREEKAKKVEEEKIEEDKSKVEEPVPEEITEEVKPEEHEKRTRKPRRSKKTEAAVVAEEAEEASK